MSIHARFSSLSLALALGSFLILGAPLAHAALYAPGATLDPACAPTDSNCGISSITASSTANSFPYYAANGSVLSATTTLTILSNGSFGIGTTSPYAPLSVVGQVVGSYFTATSTTATSTFSGGAQFNSTIAQNVSDFNDDFERADTAPGTLGTAPTGQTWMVGGAGVGGIQISNGRYISTGNTYAGINITPTPIRIGGDFSLTSTTNGFALISSSDGNLSLNSMIHFQFGYTGGSVTWWSGASQSNALASGSCSPTFSPALATDGTVYHIYMTIIGNSVHLELPDGTIQDCSDPNVSTLSGQTAIWQVGGTGARWEATTSSRPLSSTFTGPLTVLGGIQGTPIGSVTPSTVYANRIGVGTTTPTALLTVANTGSAGDTFQITGTGLSPVLAVKAYSSGYSPQIILTEGATTNANSPTIYSSGNSNDLRFKVFGSDRLVFPQTTGIGYIPTGVNFGIGTTSPYAKLSVVGETVSSYFTATSTTATSTFNGGFAVGTGASPSGLVYDRSTGFVGIGTAAPQTVLHVRSNSDGNLWVRNAADFGGYTGVALVSYSDGISPRDLLLSGNTIRLLQSGTEYVTMTTTGNVGIGTTTPYARLTVWGTDTASTTSFTVANSASTTVFAVYNNGNSTYSGLIFQSSDERLKTNITPLDASSSLAAILGLNPVSYTRIDQPDLGTNLGFVAQDVQQIFPNLVSTTSPTALTPDGTLTLNYVGLIAPIVEAIKALAGEVRNFAQSVTTAVVNATTVNSQQNNTQKLCVGSTCITESELKEILQNNRQTIISPPAINDMEADSSATISDNSATNTDATTTPQTDTTDVIPISTPPTTNTDYSATDTSQPPTDTSSSSSDTSSPPADSSTPSATTSS